MKNVFLSLLGLVITLATFSQTQVFFTKGGLGTSKVVASRSGVSTGTTNRIYLVRGVIFSTTFTVSKTSRVSVGIYNAAGILVRTLISNELYYAGTYPIEWDGYDDVDNLVLDGAYTLIKVESNVTYTWEGLVGNTSDSLTGLSKWRGFQGMFDMCVTGNNAYFATGYEEGWNANYKVDLLHPQNKTELNRVVGSGNWGQSTIFAATDGNIVYWAGNVPDDTHPAFVFGTNVSNDALTVFSSGVNVPSALSKAYPSGIDVTASSVPTGLAVQKTGNYLFVAHGGLNEIHVLNKSTGALIKKITGFTNPRGLCVDTSGKLWIIHGTNTVGKFNFTISDSSLNWMEVNLTGLTSPLRLAIKPNNDSIFVMDGGNQQIVKSFNNVTGVQGTSFGQVGGYQTNPTVAHDKFYVVDRSGFTGNGFSTFLAFQTDGSFWVGDGGNYRAQHFSSARSYINNIMYYPHSYSAAVDPNNPTRVFNGFMEYQIDYSKPLDNGANGSWQLVKQWRDFASPTPSDYHFESSIFKELTTIPSNGRTYAFLGNNAAFRQDLFELTSTGLRYTGINFSYNSNDRVSLMPDGSLRIFNSNGGEHGDFTWKTRALTGFDGSGNPQWATAVTQMSFLRKDNDPNPNLPNIPATTSGILPMFGIERTNDWKGNSYHLAGIKYGDTSFRWRTSKPTYTTYTGDFPTDGAFDIGNDVVYPADAAMTIDNSIFYNYHGEFWKIGQTNKWNHYSDIGLMVGQFGYTRWDYSTASDSYYGLGGNTKAANVVKVSSNYYIYAAEESAHSGLHRWKVSNTDSVRTTSYTILKAGVPTPPTSVYEDLMAGLPAKGGVFTSGTGGWTWDNIGSTDSAIKYVKSGLAVYKKSEHSITSRFLKASDTFTIRRDLGTINSSTWEITGKMNFDNMTIPWNANGNGYIEVLDATDKIIFRLKLITVSPVLGTPVDVYINNTKIFSEDPIVFQILTKKYNMFTITKNSFQFAGYPAYTYSTPLTTGADMNAPKKFRIYYYNNGFDNNNRAVNIINLKLKRN